MLNAYFISGNAHALVAAPQIAVPHGRIVARAVADPRWHGADLFLSLRNVLPDRYPLTELTVDQLLTTGNYISRIIDYGLILPTTTDLYAHAAAVLDEPRVLDLARENVPVYAWPCQDRDVWRTTRSPVARRLVAVLLTARANPPAIVANESRRSEDVALCLPQTPS